MRLKVYPEQLSELSSQVEKKLQRAAQGRGLARHTQTLRERARATALQERNAKAEILKTSTVAQPLCNLLYITSHVITQVRDLSQVRVNVDVSFELEVCICQDDTGQLCLLAVLTPPLRGTDSHPVTNSAK